MTRSRVRVVARVGGFKSPAASFITISAVVHLAFVILMVFFPTLRPRSRPIEDFIVVTPVVFPDRGAPAVRTEAPVEPEPDPLPPEPEEEVRVEPEVPKPAPVKKPEPKKIDKPKPDRPPPTDSRGPTSPTRAPAPGEAAGAGSEATIESVDFEEIEFVWYRDRVVAALKSQWRQPILEGLRASQSVTISFEVLRDGSVRRPEIVGSSGIPSLDRSALRAVMEADPLPPLPSNWRGSVMSARFVFTWYP